MYCILGYKGEVAVGPDVFSLQVGGEKEPIDRILGAGAREGGQPEGGDMAAPDAGDDDE
jgi:hypothetical protein